ncbi:KAP family NTPase [bacterium]|nr:KAP family NTPase [bacterium]
MRLVTPEIEIDESDPFKNDKLAREPFAESLLSLITNVEDNLVISLDAPWGDGKTTFVKMWRGFLKAKGVKSLYFDAFANDSFEDPFMALVGNIDLLIEREFSDKPTTMQKLKEFKGKAVKVGTRLLSWGAKVGVKAVTLNVIKDRDIEQLKEIAEDIASDAGETASKFIEDKMNSYKEVLNATEEFRKKLSELAEEVYTENQKPLVFIIDELDRCKPTYALELIEKVKHLFSVKHIVFVLVMHTKQLEESVKCVYGQNIEARTYLQKFINIEYKLPKENVMRVPISENDYVKYCKALCGLHALPIGGWVEAMWILGQLFKLSLRDLQRCFTNLTLFFASTEKNQYRDNYLLALLVILKVKSPEMFELVKTKGISLDELWKDLGFDKLISGQEENWKVYLRQILEVCLLPKSDFDQLDEKSRGKRHWLELGWKYNFRERSDILPYHCRQIESFKFLQEKDSNHKDGAK